jgi:hypothetical protein
MTQVSFGDVELTKDMPRARHHALTPVQVASLYALAELPVPKIEEPGRRPALPARTTQSKDSESADANDRPQRSSRPPRNVREAAKASSTGGPRRDGVVRQATKAKSSSRSGVKEFPVSKDRGVQRSRKPQTSR